MPENTETLSGKFLTKSKYSDERTLSALMKVCIFKRCLKTFLFGSWDYGAL